MPFPHTPCYCTSRVPRRIEQSSAAYIMRSSAPVAFCFLIPVCISCRIQHVRHNFSPNSAGEPREARDQWIELQLHRGCKKLPTTLCRACIQFCSFPLHPGPRLSLISLIFSLVQSEASIHAAASLLMPASGIGALASQSAFRSAPFPP